MSKALICNLCEDGEMTHQEHKGTHIYICDQCPNIQLEFMNQSDTENLLDLMITRSNSIRSDEGGETV